jgi:hypothetical protein
MSHPIRHTAIVIVALTVLLLPAGTMLANRQGMPEPSFTLYATSGMGRAYQPLDPVTLQNMTGGQPLTFEFDWPGLAVSADGSTSVVIDPSQGPLDDWIVVYDGLGGPERLAITVEEAVFNPRLSADGSRLVVEPGIMCGPSGCGERTWYTYDTRTGELLSTTHLDSSDPVWPDMLAPAGNRLYYPFVERQERGTDPATPASTGIASGPWPLQIATFDLDTGLEIARTRVPQVFAGSWQAESIDQMYVGEMELPAIALSPDGSRIAVVNPAMTTLTLIDTGTLEVEDVHSIYVPVGWTGRFLEWLGIAPQTAEAKVSRGRSLRAVFAADGQHLYLTGYETTVGETIEGYEGHGFGLMRIDTGTGEITASALEGLDADMILPSPDGEFVYLLRPEIPWWNNDGQSPGYVVERFDAESLAPLAQRTFEGWLQLMVAPAATPFRTGP